MRSASPAAKEAQRLGSLPAPEAAEKVAPSSSTLATEATSLADHDHESCSSAAASFSSGGALLELTSVCSAPGRRNESTERSQTVYNTKSTGAHTQRELV